LTPAVGEIEDGQSAVHESNLRGLRLTGAAREYEVATGPSQESAIVRTAVAQSLRKAFKDRRQTLDWRCRDHPRYSAHGLRGSNALTTGTHAPPNDSDAKQTFPDEIAVTTGRLKTRLKSGVFKPGDNLVEAVLMRISWRERVA
jgi:hypothetical protein